MTNSIDSTTKWIIIQTVNMKTSVRPTKAIPYNPVMYPAPAMKR